MNSLTTQYRRSQLIALPVTGGKNPVQFVYGVRVQNSVEPVSYPFAEWVVDDFNSQAEKVTCENSTDAIGTTGESKFTLLAGSLKKDRSFSNGQVIRTNACSHLSSSGRNSSGWTNE